MKCYVIKNGKKYIAFYGDSQTTKLEKAWLFFSKKDAQDNLCDNENIVPAEVTVTEIIKDGEKY